MKPRKPKKPSTLPSRETAATIPRFEMTTKLGHRITVARIGAQVAAIADRERRMELAR
ncbi:hypothetical protein FB480_103428 [Agrobacterium vitis]|nr:hypothetical protein FB480_103428 [Agrobacterium vitis]